MTPGAFHPSRLRAIGGRWGDLPRWWPTPGWALAWWVAGWHQAERDHRPRLRGAFASLAAAWAWATNPRASTGEQNGG